MYTICVWYCDSAGKESACNAGDLGLIPGLANATLYNGYTDTMEKMLTRLDMDLEYLENHNLWVDITIIFKTGMSILAGKKF